MVVVFTITELSYLVLCLFCDGMLPFPIVVSNWVCVF